MNSLLLEYEKGTYYLTSGVTSRGANPVPPVVNIKLSSFSSHQSIRVSWKKTVTLSHAEELTCLLKTYPNPHTQIPYKEWGNADSFQQSRRKFWSAIYGTDLLRSKHTAVGVFILCSIENEEESIKVLKINETQEIP